MTSTEPQGFSQEKVVLMTARRLGVNPARVEEFLEAYADSFVMHARETDPAIIMPMPQVKPEPAKAPAKARKRTPAKKAAAAKVANPKPTDEVKIENADAEVQTALMAANNPE